jgi:ankyrin repeat protein
MKTAPIHAASQNGHSEVVKALLQARADPNALTKHESYINALHMALENKHDEVVIELLKGGADSNLPRRDKWGATPLHEASKYGSSEIVRALLDAKANPDSLMKGDLTPIHLASIVGNKEVAEILIGAGANLNLKDEDGKTPLHHALLNGKLKIAKILVKNGADINAPMNNGITPTEILNKIKELSEAKSARSEIKSEKDSSPMKVESDSGARAKGDDSLSEGMAKISIKQEAGEGVRLRGEVVAERLKAPACDLEQLD